MSSAASVLVKEYKELSKEKWVTIDFDEDNVFQWNMVLMVLNPDSVYAGAYLKCSMTFPKNYPYAPPDFRFSKPLWHPNIYTDGRICISILHAPGEDAVSGESSGERWSPAQRVESVLISILSLLDDPEINSPANVDASVMYRDDKSKFADRVKQDVVKSRTDMPEGFIMPSHETRTVVAAPVNDDDFWADSADEFDFGDDDDMGSGTEEDENGDEFEAGSSDEEPESEEETLIQTREDRLDSDMTEPDD